MKLKTSKTEITTWIILTIGALIAGALITTGYRAALKLRHEIRNMDVKQGVIDAGKEIKDIYRQIEAD